MAWVMNGVAALDALDAGPVPTEFVALTVKVYEVPLVRPVIVWVVAVVPAFESVPPAGDETTV